MGPASIIAVRDISFAYRVGGRQQRILDHVELEIRPGEVLGLAGESGCGKSSLAYLLLGYRPPNGVIEGGQVLFQGQDLLRMPAGELSRLRGMRISFVPQNPTTALSPGMRVGRQVAEILLYHGVTRDPAAANARVVSLFQLVGLPAPGQIGQRYPHELSGGQQQRVAIAMAVACDPSLVVLDEPTTGLDVTTQKQIITLLNSLRARLGMSMLYVTHDLGVLATLADRVGVMYAGHLVEIAPTPTLFEWPRHPYTRGLIGAMRSVEDNGRSRGQALKGLLRREELPAGCPFKPRCEFAEASCASMRQQLEEVGPDQAVACQRWTAIERQLANTNATPCAPPMQQLEGNLLLEVRNVTLAYGQHRYAALNKFYGSARPVVHAVSFEIAGGETLAIVGESGSGKSTLARAISGILEPTGGQIVFEGIALQGSMKRRPIEMRRRIQYIFQNPDASLNPRARVGSILARPLEVFFGLDRSAAGRRIEAVLADVRLPAGYSNRYPDELSGGERQRVAIARALIADPDLLLCDEILSALDVSVQANILDLLVQLRHEHRISILFISHDLAVVRDIADRVAVLYSGHVLEIGATAAVYEPPFHPYTHSLLMAVPGLPLGTKVAPELRNEPPPPVGMGCPFAGRCPWQLGDICRSESPPWRTTKSGKHIRCHIVPQELDNLAVWRPKREAPKPKLIPPSIAAN